MRNWANISAAAGFVLTLALGGNALAHHKAGHDAGPPGGGGDHNTVTKDFVAGPLVPSTGAVLDLDPIFGLDMDGTPNNTADTFKDALDEGIIGVALAVSQGYVYKMDISADDLSFIVDISPAEYDISPRLQDVFDLSGGAANCVDFDANAVSCTDADGICHDAGGNPLGTGSNDSCLGVVSDSATCWVDWTRPPGATANEKDPNRHLQPEFVQVLVDDNDATNDPNVCTVHVFVETDGNPGHFVEDGDDNPDNDFTLWEPTGCKAFSHDGVLLEAADSSAYVESILLNDGVSEYGPADGDRVQGPNEHMLLTPIGCDSDGDGTIDELDGFPADATQA